MRHELQLESLTIKTKEKMAWGQVICGFLEPDVATSQMDREAILAGFVKGELPCRCDTCVEDGWDLGGVDGRAMEQEFKLLKEALWS